MTEQIEGILERTPIKYREVLMLCAMQGESYEDAAKIIGCSKSAVAVRIFRARKYFGKMIEELRR